MPRTPLKDLMQAYYGSGRTSRSLEVLSAALTGRVVHQGKLSRKVHSVLSFVGGLGVYFGGPARGEDHGDTWISLHEIQELDGKLVYQPRSKEFLRGVEHERARIVALLREVDRVPGWDGTLENLMPALVELVAQDP